ncbi:MAG: acyl carrier protein, partial [Phycisphaerales bacterium]|nr:acyl carrier protein [Phycisphaerales bacterium]
MTSTNESLEPMEPMAPEALLRELWTSLLGISPDAEPDFMRAGGSSLLLIEVQLGMQKRSGLRIDLESLDLPIRFEG